MMAKNNYSRWKVFCDVNRNCPETIQEQSKLLPDPPTALLIATNIQDHYRDAAVEAFVMQMLPCLVRNNVSTLVIKNMVSKNCERLPHDMKDKIVTS